MKALGGEQDIARLQVAVHDPLLVRRVHGVCQ
jgi:hypothetical protein